MTVTTYDDPEFSARVNTIANRMVYGVEQDPKANPYEVVAARLLLRWEIEETIDE